MSHDTCNENWSGVVISSIHCLLTTSNSTKCFICTLQDYVCIYISHMVKLKIKGDAT